MLSKILVSIMMLINVIFISFLVDNLIATLSFWILSGISIFYFLTKEISLPYLIETVVTDPPY